MNWNQPICAWCYNDRYPGREPVTLIERTIETCCDCGRRTGEGIYLRVDPSTVKHPKVED